MYRRALLRFAAAIVAGTILLSCSNKDGTGPDGNGPGRRVLFIGNSLTYSNDLPAMVETLANASGENLEVSSVTYGGYALEDHWVSGDARDAVRSGGNDRVILQQGPSALPESRVNLRQYAALWDAEIRRYGGIPGLYAVWPEEYRIEVFPDVTESYLAAARDIGGYFFPAGETWQETWRISPDAPLYDGDRFHPAVAGTYAAAVAIVSVLTQRMPTTLSDSYVPVGMNKDLAATIRSAAETVVRRYGFSVQD
jgi:hypothetical protein